MLKLTDIEREVLISYIGVLLKNNAEDPGKAIEAIVELFENADDDLRTILMGYRVHLSKRLQQQVLQLEGQLVRTRNSIEAISEGTK